MISRKFKTEHLKLTEELLNSKIHSGKHDYLFTREKTKSSPWEI